MGIAVNVVMRHQPVDNPWVTHQWVIDEVAVDVGQYAPWVIQEAFAVEAIKAFPIGDGALGQRWLFTGFNVEVFLDEAEGYHLNVSSDHPCWFVMWRLEHFSSSADEPMAVPYRVMLSYNEAARLLDGGEQVYQVPLDPLILESLREFVAEHYHPEVKKRHRPESFKGAARGVDSQGEWHE